MNYTVTFHHSFDDFNFSDSLCPDIEVQAEHYKNTEEMMKASNETYALEATEDASEVAAYGYAGVPP